MFVPKGMVPMAGLAGPVEVVSGPEMKMEYEDKTKPAVSFKYPGLTGWTLMVEATVGVREKKFLKGDETRVVPNAELYCEEVIIWGDRPNCKPGDYVLLEHPAVGATKAGRLYLTARGARNLPTDGAKAGGEK